MSLLMNIADTNSRLTNHLRRGAVPRSRSEDITRTCVLLLLLLVLLPLLLVGVGAPPAGAVESAPKAPAVAATLNLASSSTLAGTATSSRDHRINTTSVRQVSGANSASPTARTVCKDTAQVFPWHGAAGTVNGTFYIHGRYCVRNNRITSAQIVHTSGESKGPLGITRYDGVDGEPRAVIGKSRTTVTFRARHRFIVDVGVREVPRVFCGKIAIRIRSGSKEVSRTGCDY